MKIDKAPKRSASNFERPTAVHQAASVQHLATRFCPFHAMDEDKLEDEDANDEAFEQEEEEEDEGIRLLFSSGSASNGNKHKRLGDSTATFDEDEGHAATIKKRISMYNSKYSTMRDLRLLQISKTHWWLITLTTIGLAFIVTNVSLLLETKESGTLPQTQTHDVNLNPNPPTFSCPSLRKDNKLPKNYDETFEEDYLNKTWAKDIYEFNATFRSRHYDAWGKTYTQFKDLMRDWKVRHFIPYLTSQRSSNSSNPDHTTQPITIYESACGIGLNLYMTFEILKDEIPRIQNYGASQIVVYGNEYVAESTDIANELFDVLPPLGNVQKGAICTADSLDLFYVPAESIDLVFTGYIR